MKTFLGNDAPLPGTDTKAHPIDVVFHLGRTRRFGGWVDPEWTVLHHSMLVSMLYMRSFGMNGMQYALLHDAHEYLTGDIPTPVKNLLGQDKVRSLEKHLDAAICDSLDISEPDEEIKDIIKLCDQAALFIEAFHFCGRMGAFAHIARDVWKPMTDHRKTSLASIIQQSCPEVYTAMKDSKDFNPERRLNPWGLE